MRFPKTLNGTTSNHFWSTAAFSWLNELWLKLGDGYTIAETQQFMLLGPLPERQSQLALEYAEKTRSRVLRWSWCWRWALDVLFGPLLFPIARQA